MTNGIDHNQGNGGNSERPSTPPKPDAKSETPVSPKPLDNSGKQIKQ
jgi:hypothetical protein